MNKGAAHCKLCALFGSFEIATDSENLTVRPFLFAIVFIVGMHSSSLAWRLDLPGGGEWKGDDPQIVKETEKAAKAVVNDPLKLIVNPTSFINTTGIPTPGDFMEYVVKNPDKAIELVQNPGNLPYVPVATAIISARNAVVTNGGQRIPDEIKVFLKRWYPVDLLESIRWTTNYNLVQNSLSAAQMGFNPDTQAITFINAIVFRSEESTRDPALWAHEVYHAEQYRRWGVFGFAKQWVDNSSTGGPVEGPAYARQREAQQVLASSKSIAPPGPLGGLGGVPGPRLPQPVNNQFPAQNAFPSGFAISACGCWGFVNPAAVRPEPMCSSRLAVPAPCPGFCQLGGSPWATVCR
jgi:hypothetical protein